MISKFKKIVFFFSFFLFLPSMALADGNVSLAFSGNDSVYVGNTVEVTAYTSSISGTNSGMVSLETSFNYDTSCLELVSKKTTVGSINSANYYAYLDTTLKNGIKGKQNLVTFTFKGKKVCSSTISYTNAEAGDQAGGMNVSAGTKTIKVVEPPSSNNNLSSLTVSNGTLNFNKNTTSYTVNVDNDVASITINAKAEDAGATVSGGGTKSLNYGANTINIVVKAPSGDTKTYKITVNRQDNRSNNANLSSLSISEASIKFDKNTTTYNIEVPYSFSKLTIKATAEDAKASVKITNNSLTAEATTNVNVVVTAENGNTKTYVIKAKRGKDPNKKLSTNNYLESISVSSGVLSPIFNKEQLNYIVYVPYEVDSIDIKVNPEEKTYAKISKEEVKTLSVGNNNFKYTVTAEDESKRVYEVIVVRGINLGEDAALSNNTYLKNIKISNGVLKEDFQKDQYSYTYTKKEGFKVEAESEDEKSNVKIINQGDVVNILVEAENGEVSIYTLTLKESNSFVYIISSILFIIGFILGFIGRHLLNNRQKTLQKSEKSVIIDKTGGKNERKVKER